MIALLLAIALTDAQQTLHDDIERKMAAALTADREVIQLQWKASKRTLRDLDRAENCYAAFHLYRAKGCDAKLDALHRDMEQDHEREEKLSVLR